jgi:hypothetical protein
MLAREHPPVLKLLDSTFAMDLEKKGIHGMYVRYRPLRRSMLSKGAQFFFNSWYPRSGWIARVNKH